jgi:hypothetical protein
MTAIQFSRDHACARWPCVSPPFARVDTDPGEPSDVVALRATTSSDRSVGECATCGQCHRPTLHAGPNGPVFVDGGRRSRRASAQRMQWRRRAAQDRRDGETHDVRLARHWDGVLRRSASTRTPASRSLPRPSSSSPGGSAQCQPPGARVHVK